MRLGMSGCVNCLVSRRGQTDKFRTIRLQRSRAINSRQRAHRSSGWRVHPASCWLNPLTTQAGVRDKCCVDDCHRCFTILYVYYLHLLVRTGTTIRIVVPFVKLVVVSVQLVYRTVAFTTIFIVLTPPSAPPLPHWAAARCGSGYESVGPHC